ncbi:MAG: DnaB-like helicase C-terminal domain-containing protein [Nocardioidaceae bacterium]
MNLALQSLSGVLDQADSRLRAGTHAATRIWPTGFPALDDNLGGGFRSGELILLTGPQGLGKTTFALQILRNIALNDRSVLYFSFEHDPQTLLERLVGIEAGEFAGVPAVHLDRIRRSFEAADGKTGDIAQRLADTTGGPEAIKAIQGYADRLLLHRSSGNSTTIETIHAVVDDVRAETGHLPFVVVDYLQKVRAVDPATLEEERITGVVEGLKDLALELDVPVLAVVAADKSGSTSGKRMRTHHMRGSSALGYEADTVLIMNEKYDVVARHHLVYDTRNADRFRDYAVLTIEKNRNGMDRIDLEFRKRFNQGRFERDEQRVAEQLVDERVFIE